MRVHLLVPIAALLLPYGAAQPAGDIVAYHCVTLSTNESQDIKVNVELTIPSDATAGVQMSIGWHGTYAEGTTLRAPTTGLKLYAYAGISAFPKLTSATGVADLGTLTPGAPIPLPDTVVPLKTTAQDPGTGTVHPGAINFGPSPDERVINCKVQDPDALTEHPLTVKPATGANTPDPDTTDRTDDPTSDTTDDPIATDDPTDSSDPAATASVTTAPTGGADTGAGGESGPDGRALIVLGALITLAALAGLRRPSRSSRRAN